MKTAPGPFSESLFLPADGIALLRALPGFTLHRILAPCLQVAGQHFAAPSFSFLMGQHNFLDFACEWFETPYTYTDYWRLSISRRPNPSGIDINSDGALIAPCTIQFFDTKPISGIEIYSTQWDWQGESESEHVAYDSAISFIRNDQGAFWIWCDLDGPGIATELHFSEDPATVAPFLAGAQLRLSF